jgi:hypothetical protein
VDKTDHEYGRYGRPMYIDIDHDRNAINDEVWSSVPDFGVLGP